MRRLGEDSLRFDQTVEEHRMVVCVRASDEHWPVSFGRERELERGREARMAEANTAVTEGTGAVSPVRSLTRMRWFWRGESR